MAPSTFRPVLAIAGLAASFPDVQKQVVNTPWWPPGTENQTESIGIVSHGLVFMTAMMELEASMEASVELEISDVRDIATGAIISLSDVVECYANTGSGTAGAFRQALEAQFEKGSGPALTVFEAAGEYDWANTSVSCIAARDTDGGGLARRADGSVDAGGLRFLPGLYAPAHIPKGIDTELPAVLEEVSRRVGGKQRLLDCTAFGSHKGELRQLRRLLERHFPQGRTPALTVIQAGLEKTSRSVMLKCTAALPASPLTFHPGTVATDEYVFASAQFGNWTDAMVSLERALSPHGVGLSDVVNCAFFVRSLAVMGELFGGFYQTFNVEHFPPPSRGEFVAELECESCEVAARCVAALPVKGAASAVV